MKSRTDDVLNAFIAVHEVLLIRRDRPLPCVYNERRTVVRLLSCSRQDFAIARRTERENPVESATMRMENSLIAFVVYADNVKSCFMALSIAFFANSG